MTLKVVAATAEDATRAVQLESLAYGPSDHSKALFPGPFPEAGDDTRISTLVHQLQEDSACRWAKVVDTELEDKGENGMIAFSMWYMWEKPRETLPPTRPWGPGSNPEACELFFGGMRREWEDKMSKKPHVCTFCPSPRRLRCAPSCPVLTLKPTLYRSEAFTHRSQASEAWCRRHAAQMGHC